MITVNRLISIARLSRAAGRVSILLMALLTTSCSDIMAERRSRAAEKERDRLVEERMAKEHGEQAQRAEAAAKTRREADAAIREFALLYVPDAWAHLTELRARHGEAVERLTELKRRLEMVGVDAAADEDVNRLACVRNQIRMSIGQLESALASAYVEFVKQDAAGVSETRSNFPGRALVDALQSAAEAQQLLKTARTGGGL